jgi:23S rRNA (cytosine1962-C5)-methyltransferase
MMILTPAHWRDYELIDSGGLEKLERFGEYTLARPEPQAVWKKSLAEEKWEQLAHARYRRTRGVDPGKTDSFDKGDWIRKRQMPDQWMISYQYKEMTLKFRLGLTSFGHIGVFPEQAVNWDFIYDNLVNSSVRVNKLTSEQTKDTITSSHHHITTLQPKILNLFAYTGGASMAAKAAGADVVHVDSVKAVVNWAHEMMNASGLKDIRWVVEDALRFVRREVKRGNKYQGIILDPPAYGRGPDGEKWILQEYIDEMIAGCKSLLEPGSGLLVLSLYSMGFSALISENLVKSHFGEISEKEVGELYLPDRSGNRLPLGTFLRFAY